MVLLPARAVLAVLTTAVASTLLHAQDQPRGAQGTRADGGVATARGRVVRLGDGGDERPVAGRWVVLHRIRSATDQGAVSGAAIDSTRTDARGRFTLRYERPAGDSARFFLSTSHHGIAYVSAALPAEASEEAASITVFDTTSAPGAFVVQGRHLLIFAADSLGTHRVAEVYTVANEGTVTHIAGDSATPVWTADLPAAARDLVPGPESADAGDVIRFVDGRAAMFSAIAPGFRRVDFAYSLPASAFPVSVPIGARAPVLEILVEGERGAASGGGLVEVSPMPLEGRIFRRFQGLDVGPPSVVTIDLASPQRGGGSPTAAVIAGVIAAMGAGIILARRRRRTGPAPTARPVASVDRWPPIDAETDALARRIAELDADFARQPAQSDESRARYVEMRAQLKQRLTERLAARSGP